MLKLTMAAALASLTWTASAAVTYTANYAERVPFDGTLEKGVWKGLPWSDGFVRRADGKAPAAATTRFKACYDKAALYVAAECLEPQIAKLADEHQAHEFWLCDVIEFFSAAVKNEQLHLVCSARGNLNQEITGSTDVRTRSHTDWTAKAKIGSDRWTCCIRVPFLLFGKVPSDGEVSAPFNLCRNATPSKELSCWSHAKDFKNSSAYGRLVLRQAPANVVEDLRRAVDPSLIPETPAEREKRERTAKIMKRLYGE